MMCEDAVTNKDAYEHAWRMFDKHAAQRIQCLNFLIVVLGGIIAAAGAALSSSYPAISLLFVAVIALVLMEIFRMLERRNNALVELAEKPLEAFENQFSERAGIRMNFISSSNKMSENDHSSYGRVFIAMTFVGRALAVVLLILGLYFAGKP